MAVERGTFVVPDLHGRVALAHGLLAAAGIVNDDGDRIDHAVRVVQLGDLVNCVAVDYAKDLAMIERAPEWFDVFIVGNHELPYFGGPGFGGFKHFDDLGSKVRGLGYLPVLVVGGKTLLTHAGVHPDLGVGATAEEAERALHDAWWGFSAQSGPPGGAEAIQPCATHPYFASIGRARGGWNEYGGVTWSDWHEKRDLRYNQVHGHTPLQSGPDVRQGLGTVAINLDCGGHGDVRRIVGLWLDSNGQPGEFVEYVHEPAHA